MPKINPSTKCSAASHLALRYAAFEFEDEAYLFSLCKRRALQEGKMRRPALLTA